VSGRSSLYMRVFSDTTYTVIYGFFLLKAIAIFSKCSLLFASFFHKDFITRLNNHFILHILPQCVYGEVFYVWESTALMASILAGSFVCLSSMI
jgi:hypothetical protein